MATVRMAGGRSFINRIQMSTLFGPDSGIKINNMRRILSSPNGSFLKSHRRSIHALKTSETTSVFDNRTAFWENLCDPNPTLAFDVEKMADLLEHDNHEMRKKIRELSHDPLMKPRHNISLEEQREITLKRFQKYSEKGVVSVTDFWHNPLRIISAHEATGPVDTSLTMIMAVHFGLFGGAVAKLGTTRHHDALVKGIDTLTDLGCFGLTELGYGSNAFALETTAEYDKDTQEFIVNTPSILAQKYWVSNSVNHAKHMVVFAKLKVGEEWRGIHGILVRIRDDDMKITPGVRIDDMGNRMMMNGCDAGKIFFDNVRVPRENLLNRFSDVSEDGTFTSSIKGNGQRFIAVTDQLLSGRLCNISMSLGLTKASLAIALRYTATRLSVGPTGKSDMPVLAYQLQQRTLMPLLARAYAMSFAFDYAKDQYADVAQKLDNLDPRVHTELTNLCCVLKVLVSKQFNDTANVCREICGGPGTLTCNRFVEFIGCAHAAITGEGNNSILMQKVAKDNLTNFKPRKLAPVTEDLKNDDYLHYLLKARELTRFSELGMKLMKAGKQDFFDAWMMKESDLVQGSAYAYGELLISERVKAIIDSADTDSSIKPMLTQLRRLYLLDCVLRDLGWFAAYQLISPDGAKLVNEEAAESCRIIAPYALRLCDAFQLTDAMLSAPIALDWVEYNTADNRGEVYVQ